MVDTASSPVLLPECDHPVYDAVQSLSHRLPVAPGVRREGHPGPHSAACLLCLHAAGG